MQKLRNYVKFFHRARLIITFPQRSRTTVNRDDITRDLGYFWPLTVRLRDFWPHGHENWPRMHWWDHARRHDWESTYGAWKIMRSKSVNETWLITFDYVVKKDMWGQKGPCNRDTRHMSRSSSSMCRSHAIVWYWDILYMRFNFRFKWWVIWNAHLETSKSSKQTQNISILRNSQIYEQLLSNHAIENAS